MKTMTMIMLAGAAAFAAPAFCADGGDWFDTAVAVKTDGLPTHVRRRIEEKAAQGQTALIRYLNRTRTLHQLRAEDVVKPAPDRTMLAMSHPGAGPHGSEKAIVEAPN